MVAMMEMIQAMTAMVAAMVAAMSMRCGGDGSDGGDRSIPLYHLVRQLGVTPERHHLELSITFPGGRRTKLLAK